MPCSWFRKKKPASDAYIAEIEKAKQKTNPKNANAKGKEDLEWAQGLKSSLKSEGSSESTSTNNDDENNNAGHKSKDGHKGKQSGDEGHGHHDKGTQRLSVRIKTPKKKGEESSELEESTTDEDETTDSSESDDSSSYDSSSSDESSCSCESTDEDYDNALPFGEIFPRIGAFIKGQLSKSLREAKAEIDKKEGPQSKDLVSALKHQEGQQNEPSPHLKRLLDLPPELQNLVETSELPAELLITLKLRGGPDNSESSTEVSVGPKHLQHFLEQHKGTHRHSLEHHNGTHQHLEHHNGTHQRSLEHHNGTHPHPLEHHNGTHLHPLEHHNGTHPHSLEHHNGTHPHSLEHPNGTHPQSLEHHNGTHSHPLEHHNGTHSHPLEHHNNGTHPHSLQQEQSKGTHHTNQHSPEHHKGHPHFSDQHKGTHHAHQHFSEHHRGTHHIQQHHNVSRPRPGSCCRPSCPQRSCCHSPPPCNMDCGGGGGYNCVYNPYYPYAYNYNSGYCYSCPNCDYPDYCPEDQDCCNGLPPSHLSDYYSDAATDTGDHNCRDMHNHGHNDHNRHGQGIKGSRGGGRGGRRGSMDRAKGRDAHHNNQNQHMNRNQNHSNTNQIGSHKENNNHNENQTNHHDTKHGQSRIPKLNLHVSEKTKVV